MADRPDREPATGTPGVVALYIDPQSPYAYLAFERAPAVLGEAPQVRPVTLGPIFARRGHGSWAHTDRREAEMEEVERRGRAQGLPTVRWPPGWPFQSLTPARALMWAHLRGAGARFLSALFSATFARGEDPTDPDVLRHAAAAAGLDPEALEGGIVDAATKSALQAATDAAWRAGVAGVPTTAVGDRLFYGDDRLEEAAAALRATRD